LACLATAIKDLNVKTDILDLNFLLLGELRGVDAPDLYSKLIEILDRYLSQHPDTHYFGVSTGVIVPTIFDNPRHPFLEVLKHLMELDKGLVIAGGAPATIEARNLIEGGWAHIVFKGEAEDRLRCIFDPKAKAMSGICYLEDGKYTESRGSDEMVQFTGSLIPMYEQIPVEKYHTVGSLSPFSRMVGTEVPYSTMQLIRGCRMKCTFCGLTQYRGSNEVCEYPTDILFNEVNYLVRERGILHFAWQDEDLLASRDAIMAFLTQIAKAPWKITWEADIGLIAVYLDDELLQLMARSGCIGFRIGIESGNEEILKQIKKPATKRKLRLVSQMLQRYPQFYVVGLYMLGFEGEKYGQMFDTLDFAIEMNISWGHFCVYQEIKETNLEKRDLKTYRDWLPSMQKVVGSSEAVAPPIQLTGKEIFALPSDQVHDPALKQELWFAFNLIVNYLLNKNLKPGGNLLSFIRWLKGLQMTYPQHPVMSLFLALGHLIEGKRIEAHVQYVKTLKNLHASNYWSDRFKGYQLDRILEAYPFEGIEISGFLKEIVKGYGCKASAS